MNHYIIEVVFEEGHKLADVNWRGPGSVGGSYGYRTSPDADLPTILAAVGDLILEDENETR